MRKFLLSYYVELIDEYLMRKNYLCEIIRFNETNDVAIKW